MARGATLLKLLDDLRAEAGLSLNPSHNAQARDVQVLKLRRTQERLWEDTAWPHLKVDRFIKLQAGQRYYDPKATLERAVAGALVPAAVGLDIDRIESIEVRWGDQWIPLMPGIDGKHYSVWDSDLDERSWPVERWAISEGEMLEMWPLPAANADDATLDGFLKLRGTRRLNRLVDDGDRADLDDRLITLYAAAELVTDQKQAQRLLAMAAARLRTLLGNMTPAKTFRLFGEQQSVRELKGPPRVHYRDRETR